MASSILIRLGGLAAMAGGIIFGVRESLLERLYEPPGLITLFLLSEMAAIVALHLLHRGRERYGLGGTIACATALVGMVLTVGGYILSRRYERLRVISLERLGTTMFLVGVLVATAGLIFLTMFTLDAEVLPPWAGATLILGNPLFAVLIHVVTNSLVPPIGSWLVAVPWIVVGFAVFRAAGRRTEQPPRVR
jgi:hypothetical protein